MSAQQSACVMPQEAMNMAQCRQAEPIVLKPAREPYIGSVRFFKHIFVGIWLSLIIVPSLVCILLAVHMSALRQEQKALTSRLEEASAALQQLQQQSLMPSAQLGTYVWQAPQVLPEPQPQADTPAYTQLYPDFYAPTTAFSSVAPENTCYLTFDDGPSPRTDEVLDILEREGIKATFFVTLQDTEANRQRLKRAADAGHTIGLHSSSHRYTEIYESVEAFLADYYQLYTWIGQTTGQYPTVFRFPGGSINNYNRATYQEIIAEMSRRGFVYFDWNVSSADAATPIPSAAQIRRNCAQGMGGYSRAVVLMHDSNAKYTTVAALPDIIADARAAGYSFAPLTGEVKPVTFGYRDDG